jgi:hypothetical protein
MCGCSDTGTVTSPTNLYEAPAGQSRILAVISSGSSIQVSDCTNGWCRTSWSGRSGFILAKKVRIGDAAGTEDADREGEDTGEGDQMPAPNAPNDVSPDD